MSAKDAQHYVELWALLPLQRRVIFWGWLMGLAVPALLRGCPFMSPVKSVVTCHLTVILWTRK